MSGLPIGTLAWCGGIIDAIGHLAIRETDAGSHIAQVSVSTSNFPIAQRLADLTGIKVVTVTRDYKRLGCSKHCTESHLHVRSETARWSLTGARAIMFLTAIRPHLMTKAEDADAPIASTRGAPSKPATSLKMAELGWPVAA